MVIHVGLETQLPEFLASKNDRCYLRHVRDVIHFFFDSPVTDHFIMSSPSYLLSYELNNELKKPSEFKSPVERLIMLLLRLPRWENSQMQLVVMLIGLLNSKGHDW